MPEDKNESGKKPFADFKRAVWHQAFKILLEFIFQHSKTGCSVFCGDEIERLIVPLILILSADYEEQ